MKSLDVILRKLEEDLNIIGFIAGYPTKIHKEIWSDIDNNGDSRIKICFDSYDDQG